MEPVFIGNFRSGTTLLVNMLGLHEAIAPWFETKGFCEALRWLRVLNQPETEEQELRLIKLPGPDGFSGKAVAERMWNDFCATAARIDGRSPSGKAGSERYPIGHDHVLYSLAEAERALDVWLDELSGSEDPQRIAEATGKLIGVLGARHAELAGKPCWVNKTPELPRFGQELRQCLGRCRIILMIRDGRDVIRSALGLGWGQPAEIAQWWQGMIEQSRRASEDHPDDYLEMHYEGLLEHPVASMDRVLEFIGYPAEGGRLVDRYQRSSPLMIHPQSRVPLADVDTAQLDAGLMNSLGYR